MGGWLSQVDGPVQKRNTAGRARNSEPPRDSSIREEIHEEVPVFHRRRVGDRCYGTRAGDGFGGTHVIFSIFEKTIQNLDVTPKIKVVTVPGQGGNKGAKEAAKSKTDGCTLFAIHQSAITSYLNGRIKFQYDNFETVSLLTSTPDIVGASGKVPWNSFGEFKKAVLAAPDTVKVGATFGSTSQFYWLILEDLTGMKFKFVPYDGTRERMTALLSGAIQMGGLNVASGRKYMESGDLKGFAIAAAERSKHLPNMPTLKELGVDMIYALDRGIVAPKGTSAEVIDHWSQIFKKAAEDPGLMKQMDAKGTEVNPDFPDGTDNC